MTAGRDRSAGLWPAEVTAAVDGGDRLRRVVSEMSAGACSFLLLLILLACGLPARADSSADLRLIAILENERQLQAEPEIRLESYFKSADAMVRARAVLAAARIGDSSLIPSLCHLTSDSERDVRMGLAFALGQIRSRDGLGCVGSLLKDSDPEVRRLAIDAAGRIGGLETTALVVPFLDDSLPQLREQAGLALALIKDKGSVDVLLRRVAMSDPAQWSYVAALYRIADDRSVPALHAILANPSASPSTGDPSSLLFALKALWGLKKPLAAEELDRLLQHADARVQQNALDTAANGGDKAACNVIRKHFDKFSASHSRWKAVEALAALECSTVDEKLKYLGSADPVIRAAALKLISKTEAERYVSAFDRASGDSSYLVRVQAAQSIAGLSVDSALPILKRLLNDADSAVKLAALETLGSFLPKTEDLALPFLKGADSAARGIVIEALAATKDRKYLPLLIQAFESYRDLDTQVSVIDAMPEYSDSNCLAVLRTGLTSPNYTIRKHAVDALTKLNGPVLYNDGKAILVDSFLARTGKVHQSVIASYPAAYGRIPDREVVLRLERGEVRLRLLGAEAPVHAANFLELAQKGFYNGLRIHRVVPNFVIQGGDPRGDGWGGAGTLVPDQFNLQRYTRGKLGMPSSGKDTGGSQFFITMSRQPHLDGNYTVFGEVISGMEVVDSTLPGDRILRVDVVSN